MKPKLAIIISLAIMLTGLGCNQKNDNQQKIAIIETHFDKLKQSLQEEKLGNAKHVAELCRLIQKQHRASRAFNGMCYLDAYAYGSRILQWQMRINVVKQLIQESKSQDPLLMDELERITKGLTPESYNASLLDWVMVLDAFIKKQAQPARFIVGNFFYGQWVPANNGSFRWEWSEAYDSIKDIDPNPYYFHRIMAENLITYYNSVELQTIAPKRYQEKVQNLMEQNQKRIQAIAK